MSWARVVVVLCVLTAACTSGDGGGTSTPGSTQPENPAGPGRLAVIDESGNVAVIGPDGTNRIEVASPDEPGDGFAQPIWSPDTSKLSWSQTGDDAFAYVIHDLGSGDQSEILLEDFPFYASWAPHGDWIGLLRNGPSGVTLELLDVAKSTASVVASQSPYYFSWDPAGSGLVSHVGPGDLVTSDVAGRQVAESETDAGYLAPYWLNGGVLHLVDDQLVIDAPGPMRRPVARVRGPATFVANRQGTMVAIQALSDDPSISVALDEVPEIVSNRVSVVDIESGEARVVSESRAAAYFWSPNGESLLMLAPNAQRNALLVSVWTDGERVSYGSYIPAPTHVRDVFPFFPQYAQSMSFWSPDSRAFALVGVIDDQGGVWVQYLDEAAPTRVSGGSWAAWSP